MKLTTIEKDVLRGLISGGTLKSHRYFDGKKVYRLHPLDGSPENIPRAVVDQLKARRLIDSNKKFPAATYLLTEKGRQQAELLAKEAAALKPLSAKNYLAD